MTLDELANRYCPDLTPSSARKKLIQWIDSIPGLNDRLRELGYTPQLRVFTPAMVNAIVEAVGEP